MSDYTPPLADIRADYVRDHTRNYDEYMTGRPLTSEQEFYGDQFDRILAAHDAEVAAQALEDAVEEFEGDISPDDLRVEHPVGGRWTAEAALNAWENQGPFMDWLRARAAGIRGGQ